MLSMLLHEGRDGQALKVQEVILRALTKKIYPGGNRRPASCAVRECNSWRPPVQPSIQT